MECVSCDVLEAFLNNSGDSLSRLLNVLQAPLTNLLFVIAAIWLAIQCALLALGRNDATGVFTDALFLSLGLALLESMTLGFVREVYEVFVNVLFAVAAAAMGEAPGSSPAGTAGLLVTSIERAIFIPINSMLSVIENASYFSIFKIILYALVILIPLLLMLLLFIKYATVNLFRVTLIMALAPFIVGFSSFPWGRAIWSTAINSLVGSVVVLFAVSAAFSFVIDAITEPLRVMNDLSSGEISENTIQLVIAALFAWAGLFFIYDAANLASTLAGSSLSNISQKLPKLPDRSKSKDGAGGGDEKAPTKSTGGNDPPEGKKASDGSPDLSDGYGNHTGMEGSGRKSQHSDDYTTDKSKL